MTQAIVLLSGGLDSATCCAWAKDQGWDLYALSFDYGQRGQQIEHRCAKKVSEHFGILQHELITLSNTTMQGSALIDRSMDIPHHHEDSHTIPTTYVPARNTLFLTYALGWAEVLQVNHLIIGCSAVDFSGYPDCRPEYIEAYQTMARLAITMQEPITIHTPLMALSKKETIELGLRLGVDYRMTSSCYNPDEQGRPCGLCDSCALRIKGFEDAGTKDPLIYRS